MSLRGYLSELEKLKQELKRNKERNKFLNARIRTIEENVKTYLKEKNEVGLKYNGQAIMLKNSQTHKRKKQSDKETDLCNYLRSIGITNTSQVYNKIQDLQKGQKIENNKIVVKKIPKNKY